MEQNAGKSPTEGGMPPTLKKGEGKKTTVRLLFLVFLIVVLGVFWYSAKNNQMPEEEAANMDNNQEARKIELKGIIAWTEGTVERKVDDQWQQAGAEAELSAGDELRVSGEGRAVIALDDGSLIRLDSDTTITLSELDSEKINLTNDKGELYARVAGGGPEFNVKIDEVVFTAEGTAFKVTNLDDKKGVEVYESKVKILNEGDEDVLVDQGKKYYLKDKDNEDQEKTVTDLSKTDLSKDEFILWNKAEDAKLDAYKEKLGFLKDVEKDSGATYQALAPSSGVLSLSAKRVSDGIYLSWSINNMEAPLGFKLVKSQKPNPVYPGNNFVYLEMSNTRNYTWKITDGKTYYFRVCRYVGDACGEYSNNVVITAPRSEDVATVKSISLTGQGTVVDWKVEGSSEQGFKVVWSKNHGPTYPTRDGDQYVYYTSPETTTGKVKAFDGPGKYYVRVCEYLGGKCGVYSNEIEVLL